MTNAWKPAPDPYYARKVRESNARFEDSPPLFDEDAVRAVRQDRRIEDPLKVGPSLVEQPRPLTRISPELSFGNRLRSLIARVRVKS